jgi:hypothetical protein
MTPLAFIIFTVTSGPSEGMQFEFNERQSCTAYVLEETLDYLAANGLPSMAQCSYGNGPLTSPRPIARPEGLGQ